MDSTRNRAWRRFQARKRKGKSHTSNKLFKPEKNWKLLYLRSVKVKRAQQLGFDYPRKNSQQIIYEQYDLERHG